MITSFYAGTYGGTVTWETGGEAVTEFFRAATEYTAKPHLYAGAGYTLTGSAFTYSGGGSLNDAAGWNNTGSSITGINIAFPATAGAAAVPVNDRDMTSKVPAPVMGGTPVTYFSAPQYTGTAAWSTAGTPLAGVFQAGTVYTATVTLTAAPDWTFEGTGANAFTHTGAVTASSNADSGVVTVTFPATTSVAAVLVSDLDMTYKIPAPVMGGTPVSYFSSPQYTGWVDWHSGGAAMPHSVFQGGTAYTAAVTLAAASGWTLGGAGAFAHSGAESTAAAVDNGNGTVTVNIAFPATTSVAAIPVSDLDMTYKIPAPVRGGMPVTYFSTPQYTGWVDWFAGGTAAPHSVFQPNMTYTAKATLTAASGYTFGDPAVIPAVNFTHTGTSAITTTGGAAVTVTIVFPATTAAAAVIVNDRELTYKVPAPVNGGTPVTYFSASQYTGNVVWTVSSGRQTLTGLFEAFTEYTAQVTLTAASGYTFTGGSGSFTHTGANIITHMSGDTVNVRFPATTGVAAVTVNDLNLTGHVPAPVRGAIPVTYIATSAQYTGNVVWTVTSGGQALGGLFEAGTEYTAVVTLTAASGYTLTGVGADGFNHTGKSGISNGANSGVVTVTFPATTGVAAIPVDDLDLIYKVPVPVRGGTPAAYISSPQYTGTVDWLVGGTDAPHSVFQSNMAYTAKVTLTAAAGYSFGNPVVNMNHAGAASGVASADNGNGTITVTVPFPATTAVAAVTVSDLDLTYRVPAPVNGGTPVAYVSAPQYTGSVAWKRTDNNAGLSGLFGANTAYTATVTLTAVSGYTFAGVGAGGDQQRGFGSGNHHLSGDRQRGGGRGE